MNRLVTLSSTQSKYLEKTRETTMNKTWNKLFKLENKKTLKYDEIVRVVKSATYHSKKILDNLDEEGFLFNSLIKVY